MDKATEDLIRERAHYCCEYCLMPQEYDDLDIGEFPPKNA